jgi:hypothetical protein
VVLSEDEYVRRSETDRGFLIKDYPGKVVEVTVAVRAIFAKFGGGGIVILGAVGCLIADTERLDNLQVDQTVTLRTVVPGPGEKQTFAWKVVSGTGGPPDGSESALRSRQLERLTASFISAVREKNFAEASKGTTTPFLIDDGTAEKVLASATDLKPALQQSIGHWAEMHEYPNTVVETGAKDDRSNPREKLVDRQFEVVGKGGLYIMLGVIKPDGEVKRSEMKLLVKYVNGKPLIAGWITGDRASPY